MTSKTDEEAVIAYTSSDQIDAADDVGEFVHLATLELLPVDAAEVSDHTAADELLQQVVTYVRSGTRVEIPRPLRQRVLKTLHFAHPGMNRMKALARQHVFWPGLDQEVEGIVRNCRECPCWDGNTYLILVDALSKWPEIMQMNSTTAFSTAEALNQVFHRYGFPRELVSDNGPPFSSFEFATFCRQKGIKHTFSPPYQPHCNELFLGRSLRSSLSLLKPSRPVNTEAHRQQYRQHMKRQYDRRHGATERQFQIGDSVLALSYDQEWFQTLTDQTNNIRQGSSTSNIRHWLQRLFGNGPRARSQTPKPLHRHHVHQYLSTPRDHNVNGDHLFGSRRVNDEI
uniref:RNA-directed DNA polymerase n=1 Tax=Globodera pallida TaxID=36090 RepID=A0A183CN58_GLOPA